MPYGRYPKMKRGRKMKMSKPKPARFVKAGSASKMAPTGKRTRVHVRRPGKMSMGGYKRGRR